MEAIDPVRLQALDLSGEEVSETHVTDFLHPVLLRTTEGPYFLLLPADASSPAAWSCGLTLFAVPTAGDPGQELSVAEMLEYPRAQRLRVASLARRGDSLRIALSLAGAVG